MVLILGSLEDIKGKMSQAQIKVAGYALSAMTAFMMASLGERFDSLECNDVLSSASPAGTPSAASPSGAPAAATASLSGTANAF